MPPCEDGVLMTMRQAFIDVLEPAIFGLCRVHVERGGVARPPARTRCSALSTASGSPWRDT